MDERISLTRHVATRMLSTKPWRSLLHSTTSRAVAVQRLHNILALFPELLHHRKHRDQLYSLVDTITSLLAASPPAATADVTVTGLSSTSPLLFHLYLSALASRVLQLLPYFSTSQQLHVAERLKPHVNRSSPHLSPTLAQLRSAFVAQQPFAELHLAPHQLTFQSFQQLHAALHSSSAQSSLATSLSSPPSSSSPVNFPLSHLPRLPCPSCSTTQPFYCLRCYCGVHPLAAAVVPRVSLPFQLHIVLHPRFDRSKSTALHCRLLCAPSDDVTLHIWPHVPQWSHTATYVLWPEPQAVDVSELVLEPPSSPSATRSATLPGQRPCVVLLEATWQQAAEMRCSTPLASLPSIRLSQSRTSFWRWQDKGAAHLSSIEAVHQTAVQWPAAQQPQVTVTTCQSDYDNLLWLFALGWMRVRDYYAQHPQLLPPVSHSGYQPEPAEAAVT